MVQIDMDMPDNCVHCPCGNVQAGWCYVHDEVLERLENGYPDTTKRPDWCPIKEESDMIDRKSVLNLLRVMKDEFDSVPEAYQTFGDAIMRMNRWLDLKKLMTEKAYLKKNPLCVRCLRRGKYRKASVVWKLTNGDIESRCTECAKGKILN